jgi:hypothetical protein
VALSFDDRVLLEHITDDSQAWEGRWLCVAPASFCTRGIRAYGEATASNISRERSVFALSRMVDSNNSAGGMRGFLPQDHYN